MIYEIVTILDSVLGQSKQFAGQEYYYYCPFCNHYKPKLAVNLNKRKWQCWKCGARGSTILGLLRKLDVSREQIAKLRTLLEDEIPKVLTDDDNAVLTLPPEFHPLYLPSKSVEYRHALAYVKNRGVTDADILCHQIGYCEEGQYKGRVIIPSYDETGILNFFTGRKYFDDGYAPHMVPGVSKNIIGFSNHINWKYPLVLAEGAFDAMAIKRNVVPLFGKHVSKKLQERIIQEGVTDIYLALDKDALKDTVKIAEKFLNNGIRVYIVELDGKDPSKLGFEQMQYLIRKATQLTWMELVALKCSLGN